MNPIRFVVHRPTNGADEVECWVRNRSQGGLALWGRSGPLPMGVQLRVRPADAPEEEPWARVEVRHCKPDAGGWVFGCMLLPTSA